MNKLSVLQNKCLRCVSGAYRATPVSVLEAETHIAPMSVHLDRLQCLARARLHSGPMPSSLARAKRAIANKLRGKAGKKRVTRPSPGEKKRAWADKTTPTPTRKAPEPHPPWADPTPEEKKAYAAFETSKKNYRKAAKKAHDRSWIDEWETYKRGLNGPTPAQAGSIGTKRLKIHSLLSKAESSLATQIRTEKIGLADFLFTMKVPGATDQRCSCSWPRQTAKHVVMFCPLFDRTSLSRKISINDYGEIMESPRSIKIIVEWLMNLDLLKQFALAKLMLYSDTR